MWWLGGPGFPIVPTPDAELWAYCEMDAKLTLERMRGPVDLHMPDCGEAGVIIAMHGRKRRYRVEFRGPPYSKWGDDLITTASPFYRLHAAIEGWHASPLHTGATVTIHDQHPDFRAVWALLEEA